MSACIPLDQLSKIERCSEWDENNEQWRISRWEDTYIYMYKYIYTHIYIYIYIYLFVYVFIYMYIYVYLSKIERCSEWDENNEQWRISM